MLFRMYEFVHSIGIHFWDIPALIVLFLMAVIGGVHTLRQREREEDFEDEMERRQKKVR